MDVLREQVPGLSIAVFRIVVGVVGLLVALRYVAYGWVDTLLVDPAVHFSYPGFAWVRAWPQPWMTVHVTAMGVAALSLALGYRHRLATALFFVLLTWIELIDRTLYINHYYWLALTALLLVALPASNRCSIAALRRGPLDVPRMAVWLVRFQVGMVYVFAGLAKLNGDWLLRGEPLDTWLGARTDVPLLGGLLGVSAVAIALSWAGALFDLTIVGWLSWHRTRPYAYAVLVAFHLVTWLLFPNIGVFPLVMTLSALVFFPPDWPAHIARRVRWLRIAPIDGLGVAKRRIPSWAFGAATLYVAAMVALPIQSSLHTDTAWSGDRYQFAWRVMLTEKAGTADFRVVEPRSGDTWIVDAPYGLTVRQQAVMATDPALIVQAAHMIETELRSAGHGNVAVHADAWVAYNGRPHQRWIDPSVDLTTAQGVPLRSIVLPLER